MDFTKQNMMMKHKHKHKVNVQEHFQLKEKVYLSDTLSLKIKNIYLMLLTI